MKWYYSVLVIMAIVIFAPLIAFLLLCSFISLPFLGLKGRKEYKKSQYYLDFKMPFTSRVFDSPEYRFYNAAKARELPIEYIMQRSNGYEYFIYDNTIYLFANFDEISYNDSTDRWEITYVKYSERASVDLEEHFKMKVTLLDSCVSDLPIKLLAERVLFTEKDLTGIDLPECVFLTWNYETAFEREDLSLKLKIPQNAKDLYEMMLATPDLCGSFALIGDDNESVISWNLYDNIQVKLGVDPYDGYFGVNKIMFGKIAGSITHWHPSAAEIYPAVCAVGKRGNVLVIHTFIGGASVLYMGKEQGCPYSPSKKRLLGKMYYLKAE